MSLVINKMKSLILESNTKPRIVYAEGDNEYIQQAAEKVSDCIEPILVFRTKNNVPNNIKFRHIIIDSMDLTKYANLLYELRKNKGMTIDQANELVKHPNYLCPLLVKSNEADGEICGIDYTTKDTLKPALQIIKTDKTAKLVSSIFLLEKDNDIVCFSDCAININPKPEELANMSIMACKFVKNILSVEKPSCALLSYSTCGSGTGDSVVKVQEAMNLIKSSQESSNYSIFGEMQFDAAFDDRVRAKKAKQCSWTKKPNIFMFPNIDAGNIGCKIAQRMGKYSAFGPILIGLAAPVNDLSRGATVEDIIGTSYITAAQVVAKKR